MRNILMMLFLFSGIITLSGCYTMYGAPKPLVLVDAPKDITVSKDGKDLKVHKVSAFYKGNDTYLYPGVDMKYNEKTSVELQYGDQKATVQIETKPRNGGLIVEAICTIGIGYLIDVTTHANWQGVNTFVDVPAYLTNKPPRDQKELKKIVWDEFLR